MQFDMLMKCKDRFKRPRTVFPLTHKIILQFRNVVTISGVVCTSWNVSCLADALAECLQNSVICMVVYMASYFFIASGFEITQIPFAAVFV